MEITGMGALLWNLIAVGTVLSAAFVAISRNIVYSAFALLVTLVGVAGLYVFAGADFLAAVQVLVYVGGILILILFAVMLTTRIGEVSVTNESLRPFRAALIVAGMVGLFLAAFVWRMPWKEAALAAPAPTTARIGEELLGRYLLAFEVASVVLVAALVGAVVVARKEIGRPRAGGAGAGAGERGRAG